MSAIETPRIYDITNDGAIADELGRLRADIKRLQTAQKFLENLLKEKGVTEVDGELYRVAVSYGIETERVNWRKVAEKVGFSHQLRTAHTTVGVSDRVTVSALTKNID